MTIIFADLCRNFSSMNITASILFIPGCYLAAFIANSSVAPVYQNFCRMNFIYR